MDTDDIVQYYDSLMQLALAKCGTQTRTIPIQRCDQLFCHVHCA